MRFRTACSQFLTGFYYDILGEQADKRMKPSQRILKSALHKRPSKSLITQRKLAK